MNIKAAAFIAASMIEQDAAGVDIGLPYGPPWKRNVDK